MTLPTQCWFNIQEVKHWLIVGMNDSTVLGGVRATEGQGFKAADIIGIGINGVDAVSELSKAQATGFYGSLLPSRTYMVISPAKCFTTGLQKVLNRPNSPKLPTWC